MILKELQQEWEDNATRAELKKGFDPEKLFKKDGVFYVQQAVTEKIHYLKAKGTKFTMKDFDVIGKGSVMDVEFDIFQYPDQGSGPGVGSRLVGVTLHELVPYTGSETTLSGDELDAESDVDTPADLEQDFKDLLEEGDFPAAKEVLKHLKNHPDYKKLKKKLKKARGK